MAPRIFGTGDGPGGATQVINAHFVIALHDDGKIRILKDRFQGITGEVQMDDAIEGVSLLISHGVFGENKLKLFQEGLCKEIQIAIKDTIEKFHSKRR
jgi:hypothetical protein